LRSSVMYPSSREDGILVGTLRRARLLAATRALIPLLQHHVTGFSCVKLAVERSTGKEYACKIMSFPTLNPRYTWWCEGACTCAGLKSPFGCVSASGPSSAHVVALHAALACSVCHADDMQGTHACMHACSCMRTSCMHRDGLAWLDACGCMRTSRMNCNGLA